MELHELTYTALLLLIGIIMGLVIRFPLMVSGDKKRELDFFADIDRVRAKAERLRSTPISLSDLPLGRYRSFYFAPVGTEGGGVIALVLQATSEGDIIVNYPPLLIEVERRDRKPFDVLKNQDGVRFMPQPKNCRTAFAA